MISILLVFLAGLCFIAMTGMPIGVGLGLTGLVILHFFVGGAETMSPSTTWNLFTNYTLVSIPIFVAMGEILLVSGASKRMYDAVAPWFENVSGKLLHSNIAVCTLFSSVSGTSSSTAAAIGSVVYPELKQRGYNLHAVVGSLAAGGTLGLLIPPSVGLIVYGASRDVSIGKLFMAGVIPGVVTAGLFMAYIWIHAKMKPGANPPPPERLKTFKEKLVGLIDLWPLLALIMAVLGTLYAGLATATEAAGLGVVASILIGIFWGELTLKKLAGCFYRSALLMASLGLVLLGASILGQAVTMTGLPRDLTEALTSWNLGPYGILIVVTLLYLVLGCFFEGVSLMLITLPLVAPVLVNAGFDPVWIGIYIILMIEIGMITPPIGLNLFVLSSITNNEISVLGVAKASLGYWMIMLISVLLLTIFPALALFLPDYFF